jgi:hypothetical protein
MSANHLNKKELDTINRWLKDSGFNVDEGKTEVCLFHRLDCQQITLNINKPQIRSQDSMNVLGVTFDCNSIGLLTSTTH